MKCGCGVTPAREQQSLETKKIVATAKQIAEAPIGNLNHGIWKRQAELMKNERGKWASEQNVKQRKLNATSAGTPLGRGG